MGGGRGLGSEVGRMLAVVGEEGTDVGDFTIMLKADLFDTCYLQQNAFDEVDAATPAERQQFVFDKILEVIDLDFDFTDKTLARGVLVGAIDLFRNWNFAAYDSDEYKKILADIDAFIAAKGQSGDKPVEVGAETAGN